ncbi:TetR/AcrR family transcriptional regulator [Antrihabitans sp. YC2-6]|uniref:TetR/AcrR family transcriptional regulator n=1 Tax=Antrihabitans sp. YC2-6 TaxID=2799498 RepID=UPI0018F47938|nr:TetR/AcrR family transcriptional regulator [Antrihabitans sp. YC2-6]MBJ8344732.1 TetR/AcrR family transcriptional regulator [Antrihabitans sp. YC2-6]
MSQPTARTELIRPFRGVSANERQSRRRQLLIDTGVELFGTVGIASVTIRQVCDTSGLTKRYFYESFASLEHLIDAVLEQAVAILAGAVVPAIATSGWRDPRPVIEAGMNALQADPRLTRLLVVETHSGSLTRRRHELIDRAVEIWLTVDADHTEDPAELATRRLLAYAFAGAAGEVAMASVDGHLDLTPDEVTDQLVLLFTRITGAGT